MEPSPSLNTAPYVQTHSEWLDCVLRVRCAVAKLRPYQLELGLKIDNKQDVVCVNATGTGKTVVLMAGAIAADARREKGIALFIVPTKILVEQQAEVASRRGLRALAINQDTVRDAALAGRDLFKELAERDDVRMGVMTPKMLLEKDMTALLRKPAFARLVRWVSVDEAHLVKQEGVFQEGYRSLLLLRIRLASDATWCAATATATPAEALSIARDLGFHPGKYVNARYSVDRPNLTYIPRFYQHPTSQKRFLDLSFIVPIDMVEAADIAPSIVFANFISRGDELLIFLDTLIPGHIPRRDELIKTYNSLGSHEYRTRLKEDFQSGKVRVLIVTDTAAYGFDVPGIRRVILTDAAQTSTFSHFEQQLGRAGRDGEPAEVISFVPTWVREPAPGADENQTVKAKADAERRAALPPSLRRWHNPTPPCCPRCVSMEHNGEPYIPCGRGCCGPIHDPERSNADLAMVKRWEAYFLAKQTTDVAPRLRSNCTFRALEKPMKDSLMHMLDHWRHKVWAEIRPSDDDPCECFLPHYVMQAVVERAHVCTSLENLKIISDGFDYFDDYGLKLFEYLTKILTGFSEIFGERNPAPVSASDSDSEPTVDPTTASAGMSRLSVVATIPVLKYYCRLFKLGLGGAKNGLVDRVAAHFIAYVFLCR
ncbi:P-loop containing nucleoside triphosphate hydrolase protein [Mycena albidolilacea]|uniref:DNA 3'-5' helicase n=1 Tax=Mycena albidolilacea TaxID=1033008 RepID=A0AAD7EGV1_9AGAR|nr:P-loop containing nucleoside triphosphate hydrolase protein [Mycena albidolilacea]